MDKEVWVVSHFDTINIETLLMGVFDCAEFARGAILGWVTEDKAQITDYSNDEGWRETYYTTEGNYIVERITINEVY